MLLLPITSNTEAIAGNDFSIYFPRVAGLFNAVLTGAVGRTSKRSLIVRFAVSGPVPCSGASAGIRSWT